MTKSRLEHEPPVSMEEWGWKYHHLGIPTQAVMLGEVYVSRFRFFVSGFSTSPFGIEWMRFEPDSPIDILIQKVPHLAFEVTDLDWELENRDFKIITKPNSPAQGIRVAMIEHNGSPIELIEFERNYLVK
jgi:hypothetical protein